MSGGNGGTTAAGSMIGLPVAQSVNDVRSSLERFGNESLNAGQELRIRYSLDALNAMSVYLAGIQGRKNLVWFTGSMPWSINPDFSLVTDPTGRVDYTDDLRQLANVMTAGRIAIYPVDAHALATPTGYGPDEASTAGMGVGGDASAAGPSFHGAGVGSTADNPVSSGAAFGTQQMVSQMNAAGNHMSMENLATATGGQALYNTNGIAGAVAKVRSIAEHYYTLAYSPTNKKYDGRLRQVDVKVSQPGVRLEYRRGYYADDPAKTARQTQVSYSNPLRAVMQRGAPDATQIPFRVQVKRAMQQPGAEQPQDRVGNEGAMLRGPVVRFDFHWNVNLHDVEFTATGNGMYHGEVDAVLDAFDGNGNILNNIYATLPLNLNDAEYKSLLKSGLPMKQALDVPVGLVYLRAGVLDPSTGYTGATEFPLTVKAAE